MVLKITLESNIYSVEIFFDGLPLLQQLSLEGLRINTWGSVQEKYNDKYFFKNKFFFEVKNSKLSRLLEEESSGFFDENFDNSTHYSIVTSEEFIDIIATFEPSVKVTKL